MKIKNLKVEHFFSLEKTINQKAKHFSEILLSLLFERETVVLLMPDGGYNVGPGSCGIQEDWDELYPEDESKTSSHKEDEEQPSSAQSEGKQTFIKRILFLFFLTFSLASCSFSSGILEIKIEPQRYGFIELDKIEILDADFNVIESFEAETFRAKKIGKGWESVYRSNASGRKALHCGCNSLSARDKYPGEAVTVRYPLKNDLKDSGKYFIKIRYSKHSNITKDVMSFSLISANGQVKKVGSSKAPKPTGDWNSMSDYLIPIEIK